MVSFANNVPLLLGTFAAALNPMIGRAATAAAETTNEIFWIVETQL
jgi:hypothetical protein